MAASRVADICFDYNLEPTDKAFRSDVNRLQQYCTLTTIAELFAAVGQYVMISAPIRPLKSMQCNMPIQSLIRTMEFLRKALPHRFVDCAIGKQTCYNDIDHLPGEIKDCVLVAICNPPKNLSKIKNFVQRNALTEISQRFDQDFSLAKTLNFL